MGKLYKFIYSPRTIIIVVILFSLLFFISEGLLKNIDTRFTDFGPIKDKNGEYTTFLGIKLDNWTKVIIVYIIVLLTTLLSSYYHIITEDIKRYVHNPLVKKVGYLKYWAYITLIIEPTFSMLLHVIKFFATATFQLQYILPQILGSYISELPFLLKELKHKKFKTGKTLIL
jgi:hypothetical protein